MNGRHPKTMEQLSPFFEWIGVAFVLKHGSMVFIHALGHIFGHPCNVGVSFHGADVQFTIAKRLKSLGQLQKGHLCMGAHAGVDFALNASFNDRKKIADKPLHSINPATIAT